VTSKLLCARLHSHWSLLQQHHTSRSDQLQGQLVALTCITSSKQKVFKQKSSHKMLSVWSALVIVKSIWGGRGWGAWRVGLPSGAGSRGRFIRQPTGKQRVAEGREGRGGRKGEEAREPEGGRQGGLIFSQLVNPICFCLKG